MYLFMAMLNSCCSEGFSLVVFGRDSSLVAVPRLAAAASLAEEHRL